MKSRVNKLWLENDYLELINNNYERKIPPNIEYLEAINQSLDMEINKE